MGKLSSSSTSTRRIWVDENAEDCERRMLNNGRERWMSELDRMVLGSLRMQGAALGKVNMQIRPVGGLRLTAEV